jgi:AcrR family transcriptional regulator
MATAKSVTRTATTSQRRADLIDAAAHLLQSVGFAGATTRAIAAEADCNVGLIAYYFGGLNHLLLEALDRSSSGRLARYEGALEQATSLKKLRRQTRGLYREDCDTGHAQLLAQMVVGGLMDRELGREVAQRIQPWLDLTEVALRRAVPTAALRRALPIPEMAYATVALFLGLEVLGSLSGDQGRGQTVVNRLMSERLFRNNQDAS